MRTVATGDRGRAAASFSTRDARRLAVQAQGLADPRPRRANRGHVRRTVQRLGAVQLDAVNVVERTQFLVLFSRLGPYGRDLLHDLTGPGGDLFEFEAHAASLVPMALQPLLRFRMAAHGKRDGKWGEYERAYAEAATEYIAAVLAEVRERGPLTAAELSDPRRRRGEWWGRRSDGRRALEWLAGSGTIVGWRNPAFERVYDVPERVLPADVLAAPTPGDADAERELVAISLAALGVATAGDVADYFRLKVGQVRPHLAELVEAGDATPVDVEGWTEPAYAPAGADPGAPRRQHATLLSPFDSLIWDRKRTTRLFGFDYRVEIYVKAANRVHGYYVLPLLLGDELVARFDLKADRRGGALLVRAAHIEPEADPEEVAAAAAGELVLLATWLGLDDVHVEGRGELAPALAAAV